MLATYTFTLTLQATFENTYSANAVIKTIIYKLTT